MGKITMSDFLARREIVRKRRLESERWVEVGPDLLDACKESARIIREVPGDNANHVYQMIQSAVAKAEGEK